MLWRMHLASSADRGMRLRAQSSCARKAAARAKQLRAQSSCARKAAARAKQLRAKAAARPNQSAQTTTACSIRRATARSIPAIPRDSAEAPSWRCGGVEGGRLDFPCSVNVPGVCSGARAGVVAGVAPA